MDISKYLIIDRIEGSIAVCESSEGNMRNVPLELIEGVAIEGDLLLLKGNKYIVDEIATLQRKKEVENLVKGLWSEDEK